MAHSCLADTHRSSKTLYCTCREEKTMAMIEYIALGMVAGALWEIFGPALFALWDIVRGR